jgi:exosome complex component RRP4
MEASEGVADLKIVVPGDFLGQGLVAGHGTFVQQGT